MRECWVGDLLGRGFAVELVRNGPLGTEASAAVYVDT